MMKKIFYILLFLSTLLVQADEIRPAYLEIKESQVQQYNFLLKLPVKGGNALPITIDLPQNCTTSIEPRTYRGNGAVLNQWSMTCSKGIHGETLALKGLAESNTDVLLRLEFLNTTSQSVLLTPSKTSYTIEKEASSFQIVKTYTWLGITHILLGFDHILFVFALLLIVKNLRRLLWTITAFTLAHSITMAGATLGLVQLPQQPVEAIIALSILFLAMEIVHEKQGKIGLASRYPWIIAFIFGLLHGFGFAGALAEIGLPQQAINLALIFFNIGVELGQIMFVSAVVLLNYAVQNFKHPKLQEKVEMVVVYGIGGLSTFWFIDRVSSF